MATYDSIKFNDRHQTAILGHAIQDRHFRDRCATFGVQPRWFNFNPSEGQVWQLLAEFTAKRKRHPTLDELRAMFSTDMGPELVDRLNKEVDNATKAATKIGQDILIPDLKNWAIAATLIEKLSPGAPFMTAFNVEEDVPKSLSLLSEAVLELTRIQEAGETTNRFQSSGERVQGERAERERLRSKVLPYGIQFLDDATGGIWPTDLVVIGASSGKGKTELVTTIAKTVAKKGKRVAFFALEATEREIERRAKFPILSKLYFQQRAKDVSSGKPVSSAHVSYKDWLYGYCTAELDPFDDAGTEFVQQHYAGIQTYYRVCGDFTLQTLQTKIREISKEVDLIIVDHLGFVQAKPGSNLHEHQAATVKALTDLAREQEIPVILVAHLRKKDRAGAPLLADQEDFSGIGDIFQVANTCIMLSPAGVLDRANVDEHGTPIHRVQGDRLWDTFMAVRKARTAGSDVTNATAVLQFDAHFNQYQKNYAIGRLTNSDTQWEPIGRQGWATHGTIKDILPTNPKTRTKGASK